MSMVKNVGAKLDDKFKKGDIKESELMKEASDLLSNMKNMPGMGDLSSMLNKMGMSGLGGLGGLGGLAGLGGKGGKINMGALQSHLQQNMKNAKTTTPVAIATLRAMRELRIDGLARIHASRHCIGWPAAAPGEQSKQSAHCHHSSANPHPHHQRLDKHFDPCFTRITFHRWFKREI